MAEIEAEREHVGGQSRLGRVVGEAVGEEGEQPVHVHIIRRVPANDAFGLVQPGQRRDGDARQGEQVG